MVMLAHFLCAGVLAIGSISISNTWQSGWIAGSLNGLAFVVICFIADNREASKA